MSKTLSLLLVTMATLMVGLGGPVSACGYHPQLNGGFAVSYPGSLDVAVAVAEARRSRLLSEGFRQQFAPEIQFRRTMRNLQGLQARLDQAGRTMQGDAGLTFSLILVGPDLWSNFKVRRDVTLARFHEVGPVDGVVVVLTHPSVLRALLDGNVPIETAVEHKLVAFSGNGAETVRNLFEASFQIERHRAAATR